MAPQLKILAQNCVKRAGGDFIAVGTFSVVGTDSSGKPIPVSDSNGNQFTATPSVRQINNGSIVGDPLFVPNPSSSSPLNYRVKITVVDQGGDVYTTTQYFNCPVTDDGSGNWDFAGMKTGAGNPNALVIPGGNGASAYQLAGGDATWGSQSAWLASLKGDPGLPGDGISVTRQQDVVSGVLSTWVHHLNGIVSVSVYGDSAVEGTYEPPVFIDSNTVQIMPRYTGPMRVTFRMAQPVSFTPPIHDWEAREGSGSTFTDTGYSRSDIQVTGASITWVTFGGFTGSVPQWTSSATIAKTTAANTFSKNAPFSISARVALSFTRGVGSYILLSTINGADSALKGVQFQVVRNGSTTAYLILALVTSATAGQQVVARSAVFNLAGAEVATFGVTYDGGGAAAGIQFYKEGVLIASQSPSADALGADITSSNGYAIGSNTDGSLGIATGILGRVKVWDYIATGDQMLQASQQAGA